MSADQNPKKSFAVEKLISRANDFFILQMKLFKQRLKSALKCLLKKKEKFFTEFFLSVNCGLQQALRWH
jgi:hypothetical protein